MSQIVSQNWCQPLKAVIEPFGSALWSSFPPATPSDLRSIEKDRTVGQRQGGICWWVSGLCLALNINGGIGQAEETDSVGLYEREVKPLLQARCLACHGALQQQAELRLDTGGLIRQGGESGPAVISGQPDRSLLLERVGEQDAALRMPPEGEPLTAEEIASIRRWIQAGAHSPAQETPEADPSEHWAFVAPQRPTLPESNVDSPFLASAHPVDLFVGTELERRGLAPRPAAPREVQLRRVYLDLIGLPPTPEELAAFLADDSPSAYEAVVDRLLNDPRYGQRWARHWMDVWRYSDWYGRRDVKDVRNSAGQIYRWRDWIVNSLNAGHGYDRMVREMLAADEVAPTDYEAGVATGFLIRNYYSLNANDWMRSNVEHVGKAFLGLTFNCAHCHDHKYDPITHEDYFRFRAFFEPIFIRQDRLPDEADPGAFQDYSYAGTRQVQRLGAVRVFDREPNAPTWFYTGGDERNRLEERGSIPPGLPRIFRQEELPLPPISLPAVAWYPGLRPEIQETLLQEARTALEQARVAYEKSLADPPVIPDALQQQLAEADRELAETRERILLDGASQALSGRQSLMLDASQGGRRVLAHALNDLPRLDDGTRISFQLRILDQAHFNFQLIHKLSQGLTAAYLGFSKGEIQAYQPGTHQTFRAGSYPLSASATFQVQLDLHPTQDEGRLTVHVSGEPQPLVENVAFALNGWDPRNDAEQVMLFDAREGSRVVIDDVCIMLGDDTSSPSAEQEVYLKFDLENGPFEEGKDIHGLLGWNGERFSQAPAYSVVSAVVGDAEWAALRQKRNELQQTIRELGIRHEAAELKWLASQAELKALQARIAAENFKYGLAQDRPEADAQTAETPADFNAPEASADPENARRSPELLQRTQQASLAEREARHLRAQAERVQREAEWIATQKLPADDGERAKKQQAAAQKLTQARDTEQQAWQSRWDDSQAETYEPLSAQFPQTSTGRRRALAEWITGRENPLTARVAINHLWARHFHAPLVESMYDFGRNGASPTHPELLDWLAVEFMESGWDMRHMHRLLVTSETYRRLSSVGEAGENVRRDPENRTHWRRNVGRLESEIVRDSLLAIGGLLDTSPGGVELENSEALTTYRRSLYYSSYPEAGGKSPLGELFDAPDPLDCYRRVVSIVPQQALALTNSVLMQQVAEAVVSRYEKTEGSVPVGEQLGEERFIEHLFAAILCRSPSDQEREVCREILREQRELADQSPDSKPDRSASLALTRVLLNHNDFQAIR